METLDPAPQGQWVRLDGNRAFVGLDGAGLSGDVVYIELPKIGRQVTRGEPCAAVECTKSVVEVHSPCDGVVSDINETVYDDPDVIANKPLETWLFCVAYSEETEKAGLPLRDG